VFNVAPKDGTVLSLIAPTIPSRSCSSTGSAAWRRQSTRRS
jgi:hypothetical protein